MTPPIIQGAASTSGMVAAGATCSSPVDVTAGTAGSYVNTTGNLTSSAGGSGTASAKLEVLASVLEVPTLRWWGLLALGGLLILSGLCCAGPDRRGSVRGD